MSLCSKMDANDNDSSNGFDIEENFVGVDEAEICPADDETTSTPSLEATTDKPDASVSVPVLVPETTEGKLVNLVPSLAHPMFEELVDAGQMSNAEVAYLKAKYDSLKNLLKREMERERSHEKRVDSYRKKNQRLGEELRRFDSDLSHDESTEARRMRKTLLETRNAISLSEYRTSQYQQNIERMSERKVALEVEYTLMCQKQSDELQIQDLNEACSDLRKEIIQKRIDIDSLKDVLHNSRASVITNTSEVLELKNQEKLLMLDSVAISSVPRDLARQNEKLLRHQSEQMKLLAEADAKLSETSAHVTKTRQKRNALALEKMNIKNNLTHLKDEAFSMEKKVASLAKRYEEARNKDVFLAETKAELVMNLQHAMVERRIIRKMNYKIASQIDQNSKQVRLEEKHINVFQETCLTLEDLLQKLNRQFQFSTMPSRKIPTEKKKALQNEIEEHLKAMARQEDLSKETKMLYDESLIGKQRLQSEVDKECRQLHELIRKTTALNRRIEREAIKIREASLKGKRLKATADSKKSQVEDMKKILHNTNQKAADVNRFTEIIKDKAIRLWRMDEAMRHKIWEMKEKIRLLSDEAHVLVGKKASLTEHLGNVQSKVLMEIEQYHILRHLVIGERLNDLQMADTINEKEHNIDRLNHKVNQLAKELLGLQICYKSAVRSRNKRGMELAEREEEMSFLYERINVQTKAIDEAELGLRRKVDEISSLQVKLIDEQRSLELMRSTIPERDWHVREIYKLTEEICKSRERLVQLEEEFGDTESRSRVRFLKGTIADPRQMKLKQEHLEIRFSKKEAQVKEKQLVLRRLNQLIDGTKKRLNSGKVEALFVASHVSQLQRNLKRVTRRVMASVAELSIYRAEQISLSRTIGDQTRALQEFPTFSVACDEEEEDTAVARRRSSSEDCDRAEEIMHAEAMIVERYQSRSEEMSYLNQRPNAYLSDPMELSLPRPYGASGPFMPSRPAPTMRYFHKPNRGNSEC